MMMASDQQMREWARRNGYNVGERGRLPGFVIAAYDRNNKGDEMTLTTTETYCAMCGLSDNQHRGWCDFYEEAPTSPVLPIAEVAPAASETPILAPEPTPDLNTAAAGFAAAIAALAGAVVDEELVRKIAQDVALEVVAEVATPRVYEIHVAGREMVSVDGATHALFEKVTKIVGAGLHAYLVGPPGTGKTTLCGQVARALSLPFGMIACDPTMPASKLFGFVDAGGTYQKTVFRDVYENGGVFLFDELDNAHPGIIASINGAIANGHCPFPDGMVVRHADFRCVAAANTFGTGATRQFVGRNQLDAATLDRFVTVVVDIDETLEEALTLGAFPENVALAKEWLAKVRGWRKNVGSLQVIISPRAAIEGAKLLSIGFSMDEAAEMKVWKGIDATTRAKIEKGY